LLLGIVAANVPTVGRRSRAGITSIRSPGRGMRPVTGCGSRWTSRPAPLPQPWYHPATTYHMLFAVSPEGIPSTACWVRIPWP